MTHWLMGRLVLLPSEATSTQHVVSSNLQAEEGISGGARMRILNDVRTKINIYVARSAAVS